MSLTRTEQADRVAAQAAAQIHEFDSAHPNYELLQSALITLSIALATLSQSVREDELSAGQVAPVRVGAPGPVGRQP